MIRDQIRAVIEPLQHGSNLDAGIDAVMEVIKGLLPDGQAAVQFDAFVAKHIDCTLFEPYELKIMRQAWQAALATTGKQQVGVVQGDAWLDLQRYSPNPENTEYGWMQGMREDTASGEWVHIEDLRAISATGKMQGDALEAIDARFRSGNSIPADRAWVPLKEWESLKASLADRLPG